jgi:23S rRNA G2445 N2-methylase RlmL
VLKPKNWPYNVEHCDFFSLKPEPTPNNFIALNPPFGDRLGDPAESKNLYKKLGQAVSDWHASGFIFIPHDHLVPVFTAAIKSWRFQVTSFNHGGKQMILGMFIAP